MLKYPCPSHHSPLRVPLGKPRMRPQRGAVLITSLIFLIVLTLIALVASQSTVLETRMSTNTIIKSHATEASETLRTGTNDLLETHLYHRGWPPAVTGGDLANALFSIPDGITVSNVANWGMGNGAAELLFTNATWVQDMTLSIDGNGDGDFNDGVDQSANLFVYKTVTVNSPGSATAMVSGYEGVGKSSAGGGALMFFDLRSIGTSTGNAATVTGSNYRYVIRK